MLNIPTWLAVLETLAFLITIGTLIYNRINAVNSTKDDVKTLRNQFDQYQKDIKVFFDTCKACRTEVTTHHDAIEKHITQDFRDRISGMAEAIDEIRTHLMGAHKK